MKDAAAAGARPPVTSSRLPLLVGLFLFAVYLLSFNGRITSSDGLSMFAVTESVVKRGDLSTDQMWTFFGTKSVTAPDGEVYSKYGYGTSLVAAPFYALAYAFRFGGLMQVTLLACAVAMALTGALIVLSARRLGYSPFTSASVALLFGIASPAWVYAKEFWSESFAALTLCATFYFLLRYRGEGLTRDALMAGIALGLALAVRTTNVLLVPLFFGYAFLGRDLAALKKQTRTILALGVPVLLFLLSIFLYNYARFQNPFTTGYRADEAFSNNLLLGAYGLLFSPGKGLLVFAPFLAALPFGVWQFYKTHRRELLLFTALFVVYLALFSAWYYWWGGTNWGARFLIPTLPFLALLCAPLIQLLIAPPARTSRGALFALRALYLVLVAVSLINALAGVTVNSLTYRLRVLNGNPNADWDTIFVPALSPLIGHWQTLKPTNLDVAWVLPTPDGIQFQFLAFAVSLAFTVLCAVLLVRALLGDWMSPRGIALAAGISVFAVLVSLYFYADDPRLGGNAGYAQAVRALEELGMPRDGMVLNDDGQARFFLDRNHAPLKWYGLSRDPARWDAATQSVMAQNLASYPRVWFVYDDNNTAPNPMLDWFDENFNAVQRLDLADGVHLVRFER